jgi:hypothetical protein
LLALVLKLIPVPLHPLRPPRSIERIHAKLRNIGHKLRSHNDQWLIEAANQDEAKEPFRLCDHLFRVVS